MGKNLLNSIQMPFTKSNTFDLTHDVKMSCQFANLYPIMCMEAVPGDKFRISCESLIRFAPMVSPAMHRMDVTMHYFFVPNRLIWDNWERFITGNDLKKGLPEPVAPFIDLTPADDEKSLANYLGLPIPATTIAVSALPFAAYQLIYDEYYRDQNLINSGTGMKCVDGDNSLNGDLKILHQRCWEHDYFTSALPFAQAGPAVGLPLGDPQLKADWLTGANPGRPLFVNNNNSATTGGPATVFNHSIGTGTAVTGTPGPLPAAYDPQGTLETASTTINDLRRSFRLQEWLEKNARGGTRYIESILAHFGVKSSDARLNRPEYITGSKSPVVVSEVLNTTGTTLPQGNMAGHGISVTSGKQGSYYCEEHGYIIGIMSIMPKTAYQQGIPRHFSKFDKLDYYWPAFANIGEQEILNKEIFVDAAVPEGTFGYIPRYTEYKNMPSRVAGEFQTSLNFWHLGREFATEPALNEPFVTMQPADAKRIFAVTTPTSDDLYCHILNKVYATRKMPKFGTPTF